MKRDSDFLRALLFEYEAQEGWQILQDPTDGVDEGSRKRLGHLYILCDAGFVATVGSGTYRITNAGHDYLDAVRDEGIWKKTSAVVAQTGGSVTLEIIKALAQAFLKKQIFEQTGLDL